MKVKFTCPKCYKNSPCLSLFAAEQEQAIMSGSSANNQAQEQLGNHRIIIWEDFPYLILSILLFSTTILPSLLVALSECPSLPVAGIQCGWYLSPGGDFTSRSYKLKLIL